MCLMQGASLGDAWGVSQGGYSALFSQELADAANNAAVAALLAKQHLAGIAPEMAKDDVIIVNLSGRGDKDIDFVADRLGLND